MSLSHCSFRAAFIPVSSKHNGFSRNFTKSAIKTGFKSVVHSYQCSALSSGTDSSDFL
jgi:hypothetical protein